MLLILCLIHGDLLKLTSGRVDRPLEFGASVPPIIQNSDELTIILCCLSPADWTVKRCGCCFDMDFFAASTGIDENNQIPPV